MPSSSNPKTKGLARRLVEHEASPLPADQVSPVFRVCDTLREPLSELVGMAGFRSLLSRALVLSHGQARWLKAVHVSRNGTMEGLEEAHAHLAPDEIAEGEMFLVANILGLLLIFIGEDLTLWLVTEAWKNRGLEDVHF